MKSPLQHVYKKNKNRNVLVISAGGETSSIQCLYFTCHNDIWEVISSAIIPYPDRIGRLIENCRNQNITIDEVAWLDYKISLLFVECAKLTLARAPRGARKPHIVALNQLTLYKGPTGENESLPVWNMTIGDPVYCSRSLNAPVISDFIRYDLLSGNSGTAPMHDGNIAIARRFAGTVVLLNIGLISRMTIIDRTAGVTLLDSDTGPGMTLINRCAREINCPDGFDRDGS
ncbi:MAG: anhydro-N-acetylmuramic acid kinase, partial [Chitinispirillaceae bacterium]|nr:anhydro-N-acetylmuramic acid kinase [Chitinispirillaceae bacterium]